MTFFDFWLHFFVTGFEVRDAIALLRLDDLYIECFEIKDVKVSTPVPSIHLRWSGRVIWYKFSGRLAASHKLRELLLWLSRLWNLLQLASWRICHKDIWPWFVKRTKMYTLAKGICQTVWLDGSHFANYPWSIGDWSCLMAETRFNAITKRFHVTALCTVCRTLSFWKLMLVYCCRLCEESIFRDV